MYSIKPYKPVYLYFYGHFAVSNAFLTGTRGFGSGKLLTCDPYLPDPTRKPAELTRTRVLPYERSMK
jgi:hypothetical protein